MKRLSCFKENFQNGWVVYHPNGSFGERSSRVLFETEEIILGKQSYNGLLARLVICLVYLF